MAADKRSVATDALETLGTIISKTEARDAIHLGVEPVIADETLRPGTHIGFVNKDKRIVGPGAKVKLGIVDPFLRSPVRKGERFWLIVYPRQITSLRHVWEHPEFPLSTAAIKPDLSPEQEAKIWIEDYAMGFPMSYDTLMDAADEWVRSKRKGGWGEYLCLGGMLEGEYVSDAFWEKYQIVRGETVEVEHQGSFFTCSC